MCSSLAFHVTGPKDEAFTLGMPLSSVPPPRKLRGAGLPEGRSGSGGQVGTLEK